MRVPVEKLLYVLEHCTVEQERIIVAVIDGWFDYCAGPQPATILTFPKKEAKLVLTPASPK